MNSQSVLLDEIYIRTDLLPGDIGYITYLHGRLYREEYHYGIAFEAYVAAGLSEFYMQYDPNKDCVWVCEYNNHIVGFLLLMHRGDTAQLRYFILEKEFRNIGLGNKLMKLFVAFLEKKNYRLAFLWTTHELDAAAHLYKKYGFLLVEEKVSATFGKPVKEQRYELICEI